MENRHKNIPECEVCGNEANSICYECYMYFCDSCYKIAHSKKQDNKHKKEKIDYFVPIETKCLEHHKVPINLFCLDEKGNYLLLILNIELCCSFCLFRNKHKGHKILAVSDEDLLRKENITLESYNNKFNEIEKKANLLKEKLEKELIEIDKLYNKVNSELKISFEKKHEKLLKEENDLREKLQNEVTKIKEQLENNLSESNTIIKHNERINKGIKQFQNEERKNMIKILSYISKINKINKNMLLFGQKLIKNMKISFQEEKTDIKYEEYYFNGIQIPKEMEFKEINSNSFKVSWKKDNINIIDIDNNKIKYKVEIRKENCDDKFIQVYEGSDNSCLINNLNEETDYEIRVCCFYDNLIGNWTEIQKVKTGVLNKLKESIILKNQEDKIKTICEWINPNKKLDFNLLFRMSRDGSNCSDFHRCCDNKGETLLLFKTDQNYIFGAYTLLNWTTPNSGEINDPNDNLTFLFSLNKMKKYTKIPGKNPNTARSQKNYGPLLGDGTDLGINPNMNTGWSNCGTFLTNRELTNGDSSFNLSEMEIFQVKIIN